MLQVGINTPILQVRNLMLRHVQLLAHGRTAGSRED